MSNIFQTFSNVISEYVWISIKISLKFVPKGPIDNMRTFGSENGLAPTRRQAIIWTADNG